MYKEADGTEGGWEWGVVVIGRKEKEKGEGIKQETGEGGGKKRWGTGT